MPLLCSICSHQHPRAPEFHGSLQLPALRPLLLLSSVHTHTSRAESAPHTEGSQKSDLMKIEDKLVLKHRAQSDKLLNSHLYTQLAPSSPFPSIFSASSSPIHLDYSLSPSSVLLLNIPWQSLYILTISFKNSLISFT